MVDIAKLSEWLNTPTGFVVAALWAVVGLAGAMYMKRKHDGLAAAERLVATQHLPASQEEVDGLIEHAAGLGKREAAMHALADIRRQYGHNGVRRGHILWVMLKLDGEVPPDAVAPPFTGSERS